MGYSLFVNGDANSDRDDAVEMLAEALGGDDKIKEPKVGWAFVMPWLAFCCSIVVLVLVILASCLSKKLDKKGSQKSSKTSGPSKSSGPSSRSKVTSGGSK